MNKIILFSIFGVGIITRLWLYLINLPLNLDEATVWQVAVENSLKGLMMGNFFEVRFHPPLYYVFIHLLTYINESEYFLKFPSLIFSIISLVIIYKLVNLTVNKRIAYLSVLLYSLLPFSIFWSSQLRVYPLLFLVSLTFIYLFELAKKNNIYFYPFAILGIVGFNLDYSFIFTVMIINSYFFFSNQNIISIKKWILIDLVIISSVLPFVIIYVNKTLISIGTMNLNWVHDDGPLSIWKNIEELIYSSNIYALRFSSHPFHSIVTRNILYFLPVLLVFSFFYKNKNKLLFVLIFILPLLISFIFNQYYPVLIPKSFLISSLGLMVLIIITVECFYSDTRNLRYILYFWLIISFVSVFPFLLHNVYGGDNWKNVNSFIQKNNYRSNYVFSLPSWFNTQLIYYNHKYHYLVSKFQIINGGGKYFYDDERIIEIISEDKEFQNNCLLFDRNYVKNKLPKKFSMVKLQIKLSQYPDKFDLGSNVSLYCK